MKTIKFNFDNYVRDLISNPKIKYRECMREIKKGQDILIGKEKGMQVSKGTEFKIPSTDIDGYVPNQDSPGYKNTKYLWVIDKKGLKIVKETTYINNGEKDILVSHTNLTGGGKAYSGGEVWFLSGKRVIINAGSGAYGNTWKNQDKSPLTQHEYNKAIEFWKGIGYKVVVMPIGTRVMEIPK